MISGRTRLFVILGDPIAKVRSPEAFNAAFGRHGIDAVIVPLECAPADLATVVAGLGDRLVVAPSEVGTSVDRNAVVAFDLPVATSAGR